MCSTSNVLIGRTKCAVLFGVQSSEVQNSLLTCSSKHSSISALEEVYRDISFVNWSRSYHIPAAV